MTNPIKGDITSIFTELRPLSNPGDHIHGAIDISNSIGTKIFAPEDGIVFGYMGVRPKEGIYWKNNERPEINGEVFPFANYFYDMYGGLLCLKAHSGRVHVFCHLYGNQLFNKSSFVFDFDKNPYYEEKKQTRFPLMAYKTNQIAVSEGQHIGYLGNAGYSTGPHVHYEIHPSYKWYKWGERIDPQTLFDY